VEFLVVSELGDATEIAQTVVDLANSVQERLFDDHAEVLVLLLGQIRILFVGVVAQLLAL